MSSAVPVIKRHLKHFIRGLGFEVSFLRPRGQENLPAYVGGEFRALYRKYCDVTMVPWSGLYTTYMAIRYIIDNNISGDVVECGVWKGGCMALVAETLKNHGDTGRKIYLYDTFSGMNEPEAVDSHFTGSQSAPEHFKKLQEQGKSWSHGPKEVVKKTIGLSGYPADNFILVEGPVEETLSVHKPGPVAFLRLDTDWYQSTKAEMEHLYPLLVQGGVFLCDDYGAWQGAHKAVNEYFEKQKIHPFIQIDPSFGGISIVKR